MTKVGAVFAIVAMLSFGCGAEDSSTGEMCGNGYCGSGENVSNCPADCGGGCVPDCSEIECGGDGCGGTCGNCGRDQHCSNGSCLEECMPDCLGKECGEDGCGGSCGSCFSTEGSRDDSLCIDDECSTDWQYKTCHELVTLCELWCEDDGCLDECDAAAAPHATGQSETMDICFEEHCPDDLKGFEGFLCGVVNCNVEWDACFEAGGSCGQIFDCMDTCETDDCIVLCFLEVGNAGQLATFFNFMSCAASHCGNAPGLACMLSTASDQCAGPYALCLDKCVPDCIDKECGSDGCGGSCGVCNGDMACEEDACQCKAQHHTECVQGEVWWFDSCGEEEEFYMYCLQGEQCVNGACVKEDCQPKTSKECLGDNVYWYDSCGLLGGVAEACEYGCSGATCKQLKNKSFDSLADASVHCWFGGSKDGDGCNSNDSTGSLDVGVVNDFPQSGSERRRFYIDLGLSDFVDAGGIAQCMNDHIIEAELVLSCNGQVAGGASYTVAVVMEDWSETSIDWDNQPGVGESDQCQMYSFSSEGDEDEKCVAGKLTLDFKKCICTLLHHAKLGNAHGFLFKLVNEYDGSNTMSFWSKEKTGIENAAPVVKIEYVE